MTLFNVRGRFLNIYLWDKYVLKVVCFLNFVFNALTDVTKNTYRYCAIIRTCMRGVYLYYDVIIVFVLSNIVEVVSCGRPSVNVVHRLLPTSTTAVTASTGSGLIRAAAAAAGRLVSKTTA